MTNRIIPYNPRLKAKARELRKTGTLSEKLLWLQLKGSKTGVEFHRQTPIDEFIVDFFCHERMLAIEIDGNTHDNDAVYEADLRRQRRLESLGVMFLRFRDEEVKRNLEGVVETIRVYVQSEGKDIAP
ncbi:MAG: hypothetical protein QG656_1038 [Candidatus Hydrogenedentes bacterium]|nr:hypothetical protein [Candidatus Hydrogenedentota bacterium]